MALSSRLQNRRGACPGPRSPLDCGVLTPLLTTATIDWPPRFVVKKLPARIERDAQFILASLSWLHDLLHTACFRAGARPDAEQTRTRAKIVPDLKVWRRICTEGECDREAILCDVSPPSRFSRLSLMRISLPPIGSSMRRRRLRGVTVA
jgi:hypothetical protein